MSRFAPYARVADAFFGLGLDRRQRAAHLAAALYGLGALTLATSASFLPSRVNRLAVLYLAALALASAVPVLALPWRRFPMWTTALPLVWGVALISLVGAWAGGLSHFVLFYGLASLYVGLVSSPGAWRWFLPLTVASVTVALLGNEPWSSAADLICAAILAAVIAEVLAGAIARTDKANRDIETLLTAVTSLQGVGTELDAGDAVAELAQTLLAGDLAVVMVATHPGSSTYVNRGQRGIDLPLGSMVVDTASRSGIGLALAQGRTVFFGEADDSSLLAQSVVTKLGVRSVLFIPVPGEGGYLGCVVVGWRTAHHNPVISSEQVVTLLSEQAGILLERLRKVGRLTVEATTDALTGLSNRRDFRDALDRLRPGGAVVFLDLDHFKSLNDRLGHQAGDAVLVEFAEALRASARDGDCAARYGGEEFALVLPSAAGVDVGPAAQAVVDRLRARWTGPVTFSAGIAVHRGGESATTTVARADAALYEAKALGRNTLVVAAVEGSALPDLS